MHSEYTAAVAAKVRMMMKWCSPRISSIGCHNEVQQIVWIKTPEVYYFTIMEAGSMKSRCQQGCALPEGSRDKICFTASSLLLALPAMLACLSLQMYPPISAPIMTCVLPVCPPVCPFSPYQDTNCIGLKAYSTLGQPHLNWSPLQRLSCHVRSHSQVLRVRTSTQFFVRRHLPSRVPEEEEMKDAHLGFPQVLVLYSAGKYYIEFWKVSNYK